MGKCKYLEIIKTPQGSTYYTCHRPPFTEEGILLPAGEAQCQKCPYRKEK